MTEKVNTHVQPTKGAPVKAYKGFDKNMKCRGFQYAEGRTYEDPEAVLCEKGFHACTMPLDVLGYYVPGLGSIYREVDLNDVSEEQSNDSKACAKKIRIGAELGIAGLVKAQIEWVKEQIGFGLFEEKIKKAKAATGIRGAACATGAQGASCATGYQGASCATGYQGASCATGYQGASCATGAQGASCATGDQGASCATSDQGASCATGAQGASCATGDQGASCATGYRGASCATGDQGASCATGNLGVSCATGDQGASCTTGYRGASCATGNRGASCATGAQGASCATGYQGASCATGDQGVALASGAGGMVMGARGCALFAVERADCGEILSVASAIVDGVDIKPDTWYICKGGKLVEA